MIKVVKYHEKNVLIILIAITLYSYIKKNSISPSKFSHNPQEQKLLPLLPFTITTNEDQMCRFFQLHYNKHTFSTRDRL